MKTVIMETIPHHEQRYETVGDWFEDAVGNTRITSSAMGDWRYELLVKVHEVIERALCLKRGITEEEVSRFDKDFEAKRPLGNEDEPGDDPNAPYKKEHFFATTVERQLAAELDVDWNEYEKTISSL